VAVRSAILATAWLRVIFHIAENALQKLKIDSALCSNEINMLVDMKYERKLLKQERSLHHTASETQ